MRSIFYMPSDDLAGDAKRRVPIPKFKEEGKCGAFTHAFRRNARELCERALPWKGDFMMEMIYDCVMKENDRYFLPFLPASVQKEYEVNPQMLIYGVAADNVEVMHDGTGYAA